MHHRSTIDHGKKLDERMMPCHAENDFFVLLLLHETIALREHRKLLPNEAKIQLQEDKKVAQAKRKS